MGFSASNFSASTPWLVIIMLDLDFFGWMYLGFLLLPNGLERVKFLKTAVENLVYGWPLSLWCPIIPVRLQSGIKEIFSAIASEIESRSTTLQYVMNAKFSKHRFWHCHENGLIKTIQTIPHNLYVSVKLTLLWIKAYPGLS